MMSIEVKVPDIGDFADVEIIEVLVSEGDHIAIDDTLISLESDKATLEVPSTHNGTIQSLKVKVGDKVSKGSVIALVEATSTDDTQTPSQADSKASEVDSPSTPTATPSTQPSTQSSSTPKNTPSPATTADKDADMSCDVMVLGSGPGGYTAAFRVADLGLNVVMVEKYSSIGGVCLNVGCIPSKALLHAAKVIDEANEMTPYGIHFNKPKVDIDKLLLWKNGIISKLTGGLKTMAGQREVSIVQGVGEFIDPHHLKINTPDGNSKKIHFKNAIIAAGSKAVKLPFLPEDDRIIDSTGALELKKIPKHLLVLGGGIIGLEMATVYRALGAKISIVEMLDGLMAGADKDIVRPYQKRIAKQYENIWLQTKVVAVEASKKGLKVTFEGKNAPAKPMLFDRILSAVGRSPNGRLIKADNAGVNVDERGFIPVDNQMRTNVAHIFAIGDIVGQPMLAHKATHEAKVAAEVIAGEKRFFDARVIPAVAYTDPEVAWVGLTEAEAKQQGRQVGIGKFPWAASGRSLANGRDEGMTKVIFDKSNDRLLGVGIVGTNAGDLIAQAALAIEMDCDASDIASTIHPHPTLSESIAMATEVFEGTITDLYLPKRKK